ncbi:MAG TPA: DUF4956 domain-containing protein [Gemmatimonadales bacterium]|jgi:hypothetical protein
MDSQSRRSLTGVVLYYVVLLGGVWALVTYAPGLADLLSLGKMPTVAPMAVDLTTAPSMGLVDTTWLGAVTATVGALLLMFPVAWIYMITKRHLSYDASVVQTLIILPIAIAGILMIVQQTLALAFSLAGVVAAVRFRNTLKDTKDAVYVFLAIGVGLSAGVHVFTVALTMSLVFNAAVLGLWYFNVGNIYATPAGAKASGESAFHGLVRVTASSLDDAARMVEGILTADAKKWQRVVDDEEGGLAYLVQFRKKKKPADVVLDTLRTSGAALDLDVAYEPYE